MRQRATANPLLQSGWSLNTHTCLYSALTVTSARSWLPRTWGIDARGRGHGDGPCSSNGFAIVMTIADAPQATLAVCGVAHLQHNAVDVRHVIALSFTETPANKELDTPSPGTCNSFIFVRAGRAGWRPDSPLRAPVRERRNIPNSRDSVRAP